MSCFDVSKPNLFYFPNLFSLVLAQCTCIDISRSLYYTEASIDKDLAGNLIEQINDTATLGILSNVAKD